MKRFVPPGKRLGALLRKVDKASTNWKGFAGSMSATALLRDSGTGAMTILTIRKHKRFAMRQAARLFSVGKRPCAGLLVEVSLDGGRLAIARSYGFAIEQPVTIEIAGFAKLKAQVRWASNGLIGLRFETPLHNCELDALLQSCRPELAGSLAMRA
jgi:hypothetical protein